MNKNSQTLAKLAVVTSASFVMAASCFPDVSEVTGLDFPLCLRVDSGMGARPHLDDGDRFCIEARGSGHVLVPDVAMAEWEAIGGGTEIPLNLQSDDAQRTIWYFDVNITNHPTGGGHGPAHDMNYFALQINKTPMDARVRRAGEAGDLIHGGSAHANFD